MCNAVSKHIRLWCAWRKIFDVSYWQQFLVLINVRKDIGMVALEERRNILKEEAKCRVEE